MTVDSIESCFRIAVFGEGAEPYSLASSYLTFLIYLKEMLPWYGAVYISMQECMYTKLCIAHGCLLFKTAESLIRNLVSCCLPVELIPSGCARAADGLIGTDYPVQSYIESPISLSDAARDNANNRSYISVRRAIGAFTNADQIIAMKFLSKST
jgi:hypothetical protein